MTIDELIGMSNYLRINYFNDVPMYLIMSGINNYIICVGMPSLPDETMEYIRMIYAADVEEFKMNELRRRFDEANKKNWFMDWLGL